MTKKSGPDPRRQSTGPWRVGRHQPWSRTRLVATKRHVFSRRACGQVADSPTLQVGIGASDKYSSLALTTPVTIGLLAAAQGSSRRGLGVASACWARHRQADPLDRGGRPAAAADGGATNPEPAEPYELARLEAIGAAKRTRKRGWRVGQDEMKFSHSIQLNAVPEWSSHYMAYSNLKKAIYQLEKTEHQAAGPDVESQPLMRQHENPEIVFGRALDVELEKVSSFYVVKEKELGEETRQLLRDVGKRTPGNEAPRSDASTEEGLESDGDRPASCRPASDESGPTVPRPCSTGHMDKRDAQSMCTRMVGLYVNLCELKSYVQLNRTGFAKVLKKFDKIMGRHMRPAYMAQTLDVSCPFRPESKRLLEDRMRRLQELYADMATNGDDAAARRDLRRHLREHVVWERNTVWRDMIGLERRAAAASLGHTLVGRDSHPGLELLRAAPEMATPLGRMRLPACLLSSSIASLAAVGIVFTALLLVPIFEQDEQQNCMAMLVSVSLLWATEAIPLFATSLSIPFLCVVLKVLRSEHRPDGSMSPADAATFIFAAMWTPVIMLLLGGFTLAAALSKCKMDKLLATFVLSKAGTRPRTVLLAIMAVAAFASMLISNVAAPVLCFGIIEPVLRNLPPGSSMSRAVIMGIALASNIGGMLSPIASPQNIVALDYMQPEPTWITWCFVAIPVGILSLLLTWTLLLLTFQPSRGTTIVPIRPVRDRFSGLQWFVALVTLATVALWCASHQLEAVFGHMGVIAILPIVLFFGSGVLTKEDFNNFPWTIIVLAAGGLSLGKAVQSSGLLHTLAEGVGKAVAGMGLYGVMCVFSGLIVVVATFISHTVAAVILLPLVHDVGMAMQEPHPNLLVMAGALMCSAAMALPTSGFPNMTAVMKEDAAGQRYLSVQHFISRGVPSSVLALLVVVTAGYGLMRLTGM